MLEDTATAGSINTTEAQKTAFASESGAVNLKNVTFAELFPDIVDKIKGEHAKASADAAAALAGDGSSGSSGSTSTGADGGKSGTVATPDGGASSLDSWGGNVILIFAVALFAYVVTTILDDVDGM